MATWEGLDTVEGADIFQNDCKSPTITASPATIGTMEIECSDSFSNKSSQRSEKPGSSFTETNVARLTDVSVSIERHKKIVTNFETYVVFVVKTTSSRAEFPAGTFSVQRRYSEFEWLHRRLEDANPMFIIPPLPDKHSLTHFDRFSGPFIDKRRLALQSFIRRLAEHPILSSSPDLSVFLTADTEEFHQYRLDHGVSGVWLSRLTSSLQVATGSSTSSVGLENGQTTDTLFLDEFIHLYKEVTAFTGVVCRMERVSGRITQELHDWHFDLTDLADCLLSWAAAESCAGAGPGLIAVGRAVEHVGEAVTRLANSLDQVVAPGLREYVLYAKEVKHLLKKRDSIEAKYIELREKAAQIRTELENQSNDRHTSAGSVAGAESSVSANSSPINSIASLLKRRETPEERQERLSNRLSQLSSEANRQQDQVACANADFKSDFDRWQAVRREDMTGLLRELTGAHLKFYTEAVSAWTEAVKQLEGGGLGVASCTPTAPPHRRDF